jgi:uncharacterized membrane protein YhiD involved in acid resistance
MTDIFGLQIETIEAIIVALGTSFVGTGTVAMIVKVALGRVTKKMTDKVLLAEQENKISSDRALQTIQALNASEQILKAQIDTLSSEIDKLVQNQNTTNQSVEALLEEYKQRDVQIKELIVQEFGEDLE